MTHQSFAYIAENITNNFKKFAAWNITSCERFPVETQVERANSTAAQ
jgi:hypothetical protein